MSNRLKYETSPYLLQHAENPVNWYPWGPEAFQKAKQEDKPVFLSIGYSTCHWCHVMAHESFEDEEIADLLNRYFISVKVDKEERPDIDSIYMKVCLAFTGSGGWPTSIFMTAEQKPFFAGTYFPKSSRGGMIGMKELLTLLHEKWTDDRDSLIYNSERMVLQLSEQGRKNGVAGEALLDKAAEIYKSLYDKENGGFGCAPKFPAAHNIMFLISHYEQSGDKECLKMAEHTLLQMYRGGMFDHIGGGFCRYSTDEYFLIPHFEKMLYDNALLIQAYCKAYACTGKLLYLEIAEKTADFILSEMTSPDGGFFSAQDADTDGEEGKYYLFTPDEIKGILGAENGDRLSRHFGVTHSGNFEGKSVPNLLNSDPYDRSYDTFLTQIDMYRKKRCVLRTDDKILTSWNGLMIAALCELYRLSGKEKYLIAAKKADGFITDNLYDDGLLFVSFRAGKRGVKGFLDDYAGYIYAELSLHGATLEQKYLERAKKLTEHVLSRFKDKEGEGFYQYSTETEKLIMRPKETYDGAVPSGNSLMAYGFVRLFQLTSDQTLGKEAEKLLNFIAADAEHYPAGYAMFLTALQEFYHPPLKVTVVSADPEDKIKLPLRFPPDTALVLMSEPSKEFALLNGRTTYYACRDRSCLPPVNDPEELSL